MSKVLSIDPGISKCGVVIADIKEKKVFEAEVIIRKWSKNTQNVQINKDTDLNFLSALYDDINTPLAISVLHDFANKNEWSNLKKCCSLLGFSFANETNKKVNSVKKEIIILVKNLIKERNNARLEKNYDRADKIRNGLLNSGVVLSDNENNTEWEFLDYFDEKKLREIL